MLRYSEYAVEKLSAIQLICSHSVCALRRLSFSAFLLRVVVPSLLSHTKRHGARGWGPGLPGRLGARDQRLLVREGLRENVMKVVADRDEIEALVQELFHAVCSKQEQSKDPLVLVRVVNELLGGSRELITGVHFGELVCGRYRRNGQ